jgi:hypothetical protein
MKMMQKKIASNAIHSPIMRLIKKSKDISRQDFGVPTQRAKILSRFLAHDILAIEQSDRDGFPIWRKPPRDPQTKGPVTRAQVQQSAGAYPMAVGQ